MPSGRFSYKFAGFFRRHRLAPNKTLDIVAADVFKDVYLISGLDTFRDDLEVKGVADRDDHGDVLSG